MAVFVDIFWATIFWFQAWTFSSSNTSDIVKYCQTSFNSNTNIFYNYRQMLWGLRIYFIKFQMLSKDAASKTKTEVSKTSLMRTLSFKTILTWKLSLLKTKYLSTQVNTKVKKIGRNFSYFACSYIYSLYLKSAECCRFSFIKPIHFIPTNIQSIGILRDKHKIL